jgi:hypothetical protein
VAQIVPVKVVDADRFASARKTPLVNLLEERCQPFPSRENQTPRRTTIAPHG